MISSSNKWQLCALVCQHVCSSKHALQVTVGYVAVCLLTYRGQLRNRRLWRRSMIGRESSNRAGSSNQQGDSSRDRGFDLLPTWKMHIPDAAAILVAAVAVSYQFDALRYWP